MIKTSKEAKTVWTKEQVEIVVQNYSTMPQNDLLALLPDKTWNAIVRQARLAGIVREKWDRPSQDWSKEDLAFLVLNYSTANKDFLCEGLKREWGAIQVKASELSIARKNQSHWSQDEDDKLKALVAENKSYREIAKALGRTHQAVQRRARLAGIQHKKTDTRKVEYNYWAKEQDELIMQMYLTGKKTCEEISQFLNKTQSSVRNRLNLLGGIKTEQLLEWTPEEDKYLKEHYPVSPQQQIEQHIGRTWSAIQKRATNVLRLQRKGLVKKGQWTEEEQESLIKLCHEKASPEEIQEALPNRSWQSIYAQVTRQLKDLNLTLPKLRAWTPEEEELLKKHYHNMEIVKLLKKLPRHNINGIYARANQLGLERKKIRYYREELMKYFLDQLLPEEERQDNARPDFLGGLEYDRYYPNLKLAFEYNGIQHYEPHDSSEEARINFEKQKERDARKIKISENLGIELLIIKYDQEITLDLMTKLLLSLTQFSYCFF